MKDESLAIWPTSGWEMFELEGRKVMALRFVFPANTHDRTEESRSPAFAMSPEDMRALAADLTKAADSMGGSGTGAAAVGRH